MNIDRTRAFDLMYIGWHIFSAH